MNRRVLGRHLENLGIVPTALGDGSRAIATLEDAWRAGQPYDAVFIDQKAGDGGDALIRAIRATPLIDEVRIAMTSSMGARELSHDIDQRIDAILTKPVREQSLLDVFARLFGAHSAPPASPAAASADAGPAPARALRILLAEDNKINQQLMLTLLHRAGHRIDIVENGAEAVDGGGEQQQYDVVLMDVQMPVLDGVEATRRIRSLPGAKREVPIIALTAHAMSESKAEYLAAGMTDYLSKPLNPRLLFAKLAALSPMLRRADAAARHRPRTQGRPRR